LAMRLTTLGGSAAGPNPGQGCSGYLVESGGTTVVLDLGPGTLPELRRHADFRRLDGVVLSHLHLDHMLDVLALRYALAYNPVPPELPIPLWVPPGGTVFFRGVGESIARGDSGDSFFAVFTIREYDPEDELCIGRFAIRFHPTHHFVPCWAMRVSDGEAGALCYTADTGPTADLHSFAQDAAVLIAEGTEGRASSEPPEVRGHLTPSEAGALARDASAGVLVLSHVWAELNQFQAVTQAQVAFGGPVILAIPGMSITWTANAIESAHPR
jgi:ribonuclease BN (tRNA processing enzyme)